MPVEFDFILDTSTPATPAAAELAAGSDTGSNASDNVTSETQLTIHATGGANSIVTLQIDGGQTLQAVGSADFVVGPLSPGAHEFIVTQTDQAGNVSSASDPLIVTVDSSAPAAPTLGLDPAFDTLPLGDNQTDLEIVTLTGETAPLTSVALHRGIDLDVPVLVTTSDSLGRFTFANLALATGSNAFRAVASDTAGNTSATDLFVTSTAVDTSGPVITAGLAHDTGRSALDGITRDATITGVVHDASQVATVFADLDGGGLVDITDRLTGVGLTLDAAALGALAGGTLADGVHTLRLEATDEHGFVATPLELTFTLDTSRPLPPAAPDLLAAFDSGELDSDNITSSTTLTLRVDAAAGDMVRFVSGGIEVDHTIAAGPVDFTVGPLEDGQHAFTATLEDVAGNQSVFSTPLFVTVDTLGPALPVFDLDAASDTRPYGDSQTNLLNVRLLGNTDADAHVQLLETGHSEGMGSGHGVRPCFLFLPPLVCKHGPPPTYRVSRCDLSCHVTWQCAAGHLS